MALCLLVHSQANQFNRLKFTVTTFDFHRFAATHLCSIQPGAVDRFNNPRAARAVNHYAAAGGDCVAVTVICHHGNFSSLTYPLRRYSDRAIHGHYKYASL
ncbi:protein of unknown function [Enterobacter cancerogenus]|nr:protein of unknown function [Enterobacter cancerogenus]